MLKHEQDLYHSPIKLNRALRLQINSSAALDQQRVAGENVVVPRLLRSLGSARTVRRSLTVAPNVVQVVQDQQLEAIEAIEAI